MTTILVIKLGALGDFVLADAAFRSIYDHHTSDHAYTRIVLLTTPTFQDFSKTQGYFDEVIALPRFKYWNISGFWALYKIFKRLKPVRIYDLQMVKRTCVYAYFWEMCAYFMGHCYTWVGRIKNPFLKLFKRPRVRYIAMEAHNFSKHPLDRFTALLGNAGLSKLAPLDIRRLGVEHPEFSNIPSPYILIVPSTSNAFGGAKRWPLEHFKDTVNILTEQGYCCVVIGGPGDDHTSLRINDRVIDLTGGTQFEHIIHLASHALCAIGGDTGPMHMAAASLCPVFCMFSNIAPPASQVGARGPLHHHLSVPDLSRLDVAWVMEEFIPFLKQARTIRG